jgi:hypothetical protein
MHMLKIVSFAALAAAHPSILGQEDGAAPAADIKFKTYPIGGNSLSFGIALPTTATGKNDFIGQIVSTSTLKHNQREPNNSLLDWYRNRLGRR